MYDGQQFSTVYATTNSVITFGRPDNTYWTYPGTPSISVNSMDWVAYPSRGDEHFTIQSSDGGFQVDMSARPYGWSTSVAPTSIIVTAAINTDGTVAISYVINGPEYAGARTGAVLNNGTVVTLEQAGATRVEVAPTLAPTPEPTTSSAPSPEPTPVPTPSSEPSVSPEPTPTPSQPAEPSPVPTPTPEPTVVPSPEPTPVPTPSTTPTPVDTNTPAPVPPAPQPTPTPSPTPSPTPEPVREPEPEPIVRPLPEPLPQPEPLPEPPLPPAPEPSPEPPTPAEEPPAPAEEPPVAVEEPPAPAEEPPADAPSEPVPPVEPDKPEVAPEPKAPDAPNVEPQPIPQPEPPVVEHDSTPEPVELTDETDLESLDPETPIMLENGVVLTAEVVISLQLLENPAELLQELFTDPGAALQALGNVGADLSPEVREKAEKVVIAAVIAGNIATTAAVASAGAASTYRRKPL